MYDYTQALRRSEASRANGHEQTDVDIRGETWTILKGVFSPAHHNSSLAQLDLLEFPVGGSFLEIGSGTGLIAVNAGRAGCRTVWATDLNPAAVTNTALNAERFGVADAVTCVQSDLFASLTAAPRFDVIYWHSNNVWVPQDLEIKHIHELAYVDPGYDAHRRYFAEARNHVAPGGRVLIALSSRAARADLEELAEKEGQRLTGVRSAVVQEPEGPVSYDLLEVVPLQDTSPHPIESRRGHP
ncbi:methyltransferase domain-containing protein [Streptomyces sp. MP131-18]|uniref:methyltransferase domain-containing protein n=1 Tax=Streptomyces sp. MP131-18 TaxID=1857892 RepID=UPI00097C9420|nr:methyltransferase domain-containing protein [Streptomyces sp. MP131-18]ONK10123.1 putative methyltransferase [Streptomyces sp. MP131-18]